tara:strand:- start:576 stop:1448 length:873 start_codon:yes stop_codon:yes gene_type:complete
MSYVGNQPATNFTSLAKQDITGNGGTSYTLSHAVANVNDIAVYLNNVRQEPTEAYSVNGTALTMTGAIASSDNFYVLFLGKAIQTTVPPDGSVSTAKIASSAVDLTSKVTGVLPVANGGTGASSFNSGFTVGSTFTPTGGSTAFQFDVPENITILKITVSQIVIGGAGYHTMKLGYNNTFPDGGYGGGLTTAQNNTYKGNAGTTSQLAVGHGLFYEAKTYTGLIDCYKVDDSSNNWLITSQFNSAGSTHDFNYSTSRVQLGSGNQLNEIQFLSASGNWTTSSAQFRLFSQ